MSRIPLPVAIFEDRHQRALPPREKAFKLLLSNANFLKNIERKLTRYGLLAEDITFRQNPPATPDDILSYYAIVHFVTGDKLYVIDKFIEHECGDKFIFQRLFSAYLIDQFENELVSWDNYHDDPTFQSWPLHMHGRGHTEPMPSKEQSLPEVMQTVITKYIIPTLAGRYIR